MSINLNAPMCSRKTQTYLTEMKCGDKHLTGVTNMCGNIEKRKNQKFLFEEVIIFFRLEESQTFLPGCATSRNRDTDHLQQHPWQQQINFFPGHKLQEIFRDMLVCPLAIHGRNPTYSCSNALKRYLKRFLVY